MATLPQRVRISFSPAMINALVAGAKVETRRLAMTENAKGKIAPALWFQVPPGTPLYVREPAYREAVQIEPRTGAKLVERITYRADGEDVEAPVFTFRHRASPDGEWDQEALTRAALSLPEGAISWSHPRFMPMWATRLVVTLEGVRRERLQDITEEGAMAEGATQRAAGWSMDWTGAGRFSRRLDRVLTEEDIAHPTPREAFKAYWCYLHSPKGQPRTERAWIENPELAVVRFAVQRMAHPCWSLGR